MDERLQFIAACAVPDESFASICRRFGISRKTGYKWLARYDDDGVDGIKERRSAPITIPHRTSDDVVAAIVGLRKRHPRWGPKKLRSLLVQERPGFDWPAASTIGDILKRHGLVHPRRRRVRMPIPGAPPLPYGEPNDTWCIDFKGQFTLGDGTRCYPLTLMDGASRYLLKCEGLERPREGPVREQLELAFREFGVPSKIRSDNGPPFATMTVGGLSSLAVWWVKLGIVPERIEVGHPEQNGRHERMHRTLKDEVASPPSSTMVEQQCAFDRFRAEYNEQRPHEALGQEPPARHYAPSSRPYPAQLKSPEYEDCAVRFADGKGNISFRGKALYVGEVLAREPVGFRQVDNTRYELRYGPMVLGVIDERAATLSLATTRKRKRQPAEEGSGSDDRHLTVAHESGGDGEGDGFSARDDEVSSP